MTKIFCDICGAEIGPFSERFKVVISNPDCNDPRPSDRISEKSRFDDVCRKCKDSIVSNIKSLGVRVE